MESLKHFTTEEIIEELTNRNKEQVELYEAFIKRLTSPILCKEVLFKQDDATWYNRYTGETRNLSDTLDWIYGYYTRDMDY